MSGFLKNSLLAAVLTAFLFLPADASAQSAWGISGGLYSATLSGDEVSDDLGSRSGFNIGAFVSFPLGGIISITPGAYYVQKGAEDDEGANQGSTELDYITVPLLLQVAVTDPSRPFGASLFAGPSLGFNIGCEATGSTGGVNVSVDCDDEAKSFEASALFGAGLTLPLSDSFSFLVSGGIDIGLTDAFEDVEAKNQGWFLNGGVVFPLGL